MASNPRPTTELFSLQTSIHPVESQDDRVLAFSASEPVTQPLYADGLEAFFPIAPYKSVYEITITGAVECCVEEYTGVFTREYYRMEADALSSAFKSEVFMTPDDVKHISWRGGGHNWLWINDNTLAFWLRHNHTNIEVLQSDYESHTYRFCIDDPGKQVALAFKIPGQVPPAGKRGGLAYTKARGSLTATVRALPGRSLTLNQRRAETRANEEVDRAQVTPAAPEKASEKPAETEGTYRERWCHNIGRSSDDMIAVFAKIAAGRQNQMAALEAMNLDSDSDAYLQFKSEIDNWTASQVMQFTGRKGTNNGPATVIG